MVKKVVPAKIFMDPNQILMSFMTPWVVNFKTFLVILCFLLAKVMCTTASTQELHVEVAKPDRGLYIDIKLDIETMRLEG